MKRVLSLVLWLGAVLTAQAQWFPILAGGTPDAPTSGLIARYDSWNITESAGTFTGWTDASATAANVTSVPSAPTVVTVNGRRAVQFASGNYFEIPTTVTFNPRSVSIYLVVSYNSLTTDAWMLSSGDGFCINLGWYGDKLLVNDGANKVSAMAHGQQRMVLGVRCDATNTRASMGPETGTLTVCGAATSGNTGARVGKHINGTSPFTGRVEAILVYDHATTDAEDAQVLSYLHTRYDVTISGTDWFVAMEGDSLTFGAGISTPEYDYNWATLYSRSHGQRKYINQATSGNRLDQMATQAAAQIDAPMASNAAYSNRMLILAAGTNDIAFGDSASTLQTDFINYCNARKSATSGIKIAVTTIMPWTFITGAEETVRQTVNTWIRTTGLGVYYDYVIDWDANAILSAPSNSTYWQTDGLHTKDAGHVVQESVVSATVP